MEVAEIQPLELPPPQLSSSSSHRIQPYEMARVTRPVFLCLQNSAHSYAYVLHLLPFEAQKIRVTPIKYCYIFDPPPVKFGG
jgi:hypothetical protein